MVAVIILTFIVAIIYKVFFEIKKDGNFKSHLLEYYEKEENIKQILIMISWKIIEHI